MIKSELYLAELVKACLENTTPSDIPSDITLKEIVDIARVNHMDYMLLSPLLKTNLSEDDKELLRQKVKRSMIKTCVQVDEQKKMVKRFEEAGVVNQPMKGAYLKFIYPQPTMREMSDIDILIGEGCMDKASEILTDLGYELHQKIHHHDVYRKAPFMIIEAHHSMYDKTVDKKQYEYFSDFSKAVLNEGAKYTYNFTPEDFYVYMMSHMAKHFYKRGCGIRNIVDVYVYRNYYKGKLNEKYIDEELEKCGIYSFTKHIEKLCYIWLDNLESTQFYENLFTYMLESGIYGKDENGIWNEFAKESGESRLHYRFKLKMFYFFPPYHYMVKYHPWVEGKKALMPIAWIVRGVSGLVKKKGSKKREMLQKIDTNDIKVIQSIYKAMDFDFR